MRDQVLLLATLETKREEVAFLTQALSAQGLATTIVDVSLGSHGRCWDGQRKIRAIEQTGARLGDTVSAMLQDNVGAVIGLGGGTGGEIILRVMQALPFDFPKLLITTLPFDPRAALADNAITLVPTLVDIAGLNPTLRQVFTTTASMVAGLCQAPVADRTQQRTIGITALGATGGAAEGLVAGFSALGEESTVFHANGYGGAAFARFAETGRFKAVVDMTVHEINRWLFSGAHVPMPTRFSAGEALPRIVLPGGLNFLGLGAIDSVAPVLLARAHYQHTGQFTHVKLTDAQMVTAATALAGYLNALAGPVHVIVPMGGFSHRDSPGGEIEDPGLREICLKVLGSAAKSFSVEAISDHINAPGTSARVVAALRPHIEKSAHA